MLNLKEKAVAIAATAHGDARRPAVKGGFESSVPGLHIIGDLAGAPVIKLAMAQGVEVIDHLLKLPELQDTNRDRDVLDVLIVGAGASGLNAALAAKDHGLSYSVLEKGKLANTIEDFPEGKWVYAEPDDSPAKGKLWLDGSRKEDLIQRWNEIVEANGLEVRTQEALESLERGTDGGFIVGTSQGNTIRARRIVLATGQRGNPRKLGVPGEELEQVYHRLYSPRKYEGKNILVVGGGNSAIEAALVLAENNYVTLSYRKGEFARVFKDNSTKLDRAIAEKRIQVLFHSSVKEFRAQEAELEIDRGGSQELQTIPVDVSFVLIGAELPVKFLKKLGIRLEGEWLGGPWQALFGSLLLFLGVWFWGSDAPFGLDLESAGAWLGAAATVLSAAWLGRRAWLGDRFAFLGISFFVWYSIYGVKYGTDREFWPYRGWGYETLSFLDRSWSFWYTVLYTSLMTIFGIQALKRWGIDRKDRMQIWRYICLLAFQWTFFFIVPEFLFQWAVKYQWVGETLASNPQFADQAWRSYGVILAWPLFFYTFFYDPHIIWMVWGISLTFVVIPVFVLFHGKRYCSWICGCGGLAETFGDRWRHLAPKGKTAVRWEWMNNVILIAAVAITLLMLLRDTFPGLWSAADSGVHWYGLVADVWLVGILPVTLYPFLGGKVWCRYWCPLAKLMGMASKFYAKFGISRFKIEANDKCIGCYECSRNCQVGIPVMQYALKQETLDNETSSCIGCGICVSVCPMDTLSFGAPSKPIPLTKEAPAPAP